MNANNTALELKWMDWGKKAKVCRRYSDYSARLSRFKKGIKKILDDILKSNYTIKINRKK